jgi:hypothetical protein
VVALVLLIAEAQEELGTDPGRGGVTLTDLYGPSPAADEQVTRFHAVTRLWHAQLTTSEWDSLLDAIHLHQPSPSNAGADGSAAELRLTRWCPADLQRPVSGRSLLPDLGRPADPVLDSRIWPGDPAGRAFREAALLGSPGYQSACAALLPYLHTLGPSPRVRPLHLSNWGADMLALLVTSAADMPAGERTSLYIQLLDEPFGIRPSRLLLDRLHNDMYRLPTRELARLAVVATPVAWANITAYLDIRGHVHGIEPGLLGLDRVIDPINLRDTLNPRDLLDLRDSRNPRDVPDRLDLRDLLSLHDLPGPLDLPTPDQLDLRDLLNLIGLRDLLGSRDMLGLFALPGPRELFGLHDWCDPFGTRQFFGLIDQITKMAAWVGMAQRGLPVSTPPSLPASQHRERLTAVVPDFVARFQRLAAELGYPNPFAPDAGRSR